MDRKEMRKVVFKPNFDEISHWNWVISPQVKQNPNRMWHDISQNTLFSTDHIGKNEMQHFFSKHMHHNYAT